MLISIKLTSEHIKKLEELGYAKFNGDRYSKEIDIQSRIDVVYDNEIGRLRICTFHKTVSIDTFWGIHELYDNYIHVWQTLKEDMEKVFRIDVINGRIIKEN